MKHAERLADSLRQIVTAIDYIIDQTDTLKTFEALETNRTLQYAIERNFEIMGEAVNRIYASNKEFINAYPLLPWNDMRRMRNKLIHNYDDIDLRVIWITIKSDLPALRQQVEFLLAQIKSTK